MVALKSWYVAKSKINMYGSIGRKPERVAVGLNKKEATRLKRKFERECDGSFMYWIDFDWR